MESKEYEEAAKLLDTSPEDAEYVSLFQDRRGDALAAKGDKVAAIESYKKAITSSAAKPELQRLVRIKLNALGVDAEPVMPKAADAGKTK